jgi:integrase/recombinase XerD
MAIRLELKSVKANGKKTWVLDLRPFGEGRKFFPVKADGETFLNQKRRDMGMGWIDLSDDDRIRFVSNHQRLKAVGADIDEAVDFFLKNRVSSSPTLLPTAVQLMLTEKRQKNRRGNYIKKLDSILSNMTVGLSDLHCHEVTRQHIDTWLARDGWVGSTRKYALKDAATFFKFCIKRGWAKTNPCDGVEAPIVDDKPPGILKIAECTRLIAVAQKRVVQVMKFGKRPERVIVKPRELLGYFVIGLFCGGIRPEEIQVMPWSLVNLDERFIEVPAAIAKTRKRRIVKIPDNAADLLAKIKRRKGDICPANFRKKFRAVRAAAGVAWSHDCMRHSFASYHLAEFGSADKTATEMGHRDTDMLYAHYRELVRPADAKAFWEIK